MDAIVIAGGIPSEKSPLYKYSQGKPKAMIDINGKPMIAGVLEALNGANGVDKLIVVGLENKEDQTLISQSLKPSHPISFLPDHGGLVANGLAGLQHVYEQHGRHVEVIGCSSDIPHMEDHMVDGLIDLCRPFERILYYAAVTPEQMDAVYPDANRTFANFAGQKLAGCDIFISTTRLLDTDREMWRKMINARKNPLAMAWAVGFGSLIKLAIGRMTIDDAAALAGRMLEADRPIGVVYPGFPQLAMDGDKPHQIEILRNA